MKLTLRFHGSPIKSLGMGIRSLVLLSGGLDSVCSLYAAHQKWQGQIAAIVINYGQKAWKKEWLAAEFFANDLEIQLYTLDLVPLFQWSANALTSDQVAVPTSEVNIESLDSSIQSAQKVWVANRNGVFLNVAASLAESLNADFIVPGFNAEEAQTFPDNSVEYIEKMNACLKMSTANGVQIHCFTQSMNKEEIMQHAFALGIAVDRIWPCYFAGETLCGECESCQRFNRAKKRAKQGSA